MAKVPTPTDNRETRRADELKPGDWIRPGYLIGTKYLTKVEFVRPYPCDGAAKVLLVSWDPLYEYPEADHLGADDTVVMALPDEIPEDPNASGRDISEPDGTPQAPDGVDGPLSGPRGAHTYPGDRDGGA